MHYASLSLTYLTLDCVQECSEKSLVESHVVSGAYSFFEYAASHAVDHINECVREVCRNADAASGLSGNVEHFLHVLGELDNGMCEVDMNYFLE